MVSRQNSALTECFVRHSYVNGNDQLLLCQIIARMGTTIKYALYQRVNTRPRRGKKRERDETGVRRVSFSYVLISKLYGEHLFSQAQHAHTH